MPHLLGKKEFFTSLFVLVTGVLVAQTKTVVRTVERVQEGATYRLVLKNDSLEQFFVNGKICPPAKWPTYEGIMTDMRFSAYATPSITPKASQKGDKVTIEEDVFVEKTGGQMADDKDFGPVLKAALLKDKLMRPNRTYTVELSDKSLIINGVKQKKTVTQKYVALYYKETGTAPCKGCAFQIKLKLK